MLSLVLARQLKWRSVLSTRSVRCERLIHLTMPAAKRKISTGDLPVQPVKRRASARTAASATLIITNPDRNSEIIDAPDALRASPDGNVDERIVPGPRGSETNGIKADSPLSDVPETLEPAKRKGRVNPTEVATPAKKGRAKKNTAGKVGSVDLSTTETKPKENTSAEPGNPEADGDEAADPEEIKEALCRPPPVHSDYLPLPWKGRLGYCCLNTYLRNSNPPVVREGDSAHLVDEC